MTGGPWASVDKVGGLYKTGLGSIMGILMVGWRLDLEKVDAIIKGPHPRNLQELQMFLGLAGFYHKYIREYAKITVPMTN